MYSYKRKALSQNFLHDSCLVRRLLDYSSLGQNDLVLEIGPGSGRITQELVNRCLTVIAVEIDPVLYQSLLEKFKNQKNLILFNRDFLSFTVPKTQYKVFANIPFAIEGQIVRLLLDAPIPPTDTYLVVQHELAYRLLPSSRGNLFSTLYTPWFDFSILHHFNRKDFYPIPAVDAVLFRFKQKDFPLLDLKWKKKYQTFVRVAFRDGRPVTQNLRSMVEKERIEQAFQQLSINKHTRPTHLSMVKWIALFKQLQKVF